MFGVWSFLILCAPLAMSQWRISMFFLAIHPQIAQFHSLNCWIARKIWRVCLIVTPNIEGFETQKPDAMDIIHPGRVWLLLGRSPVQYYQYQKRVEWNHTSIWLSSDRDINYESFWLSRLDHHHWTLNFWAVSSRDPHSMRKNLTRIWSRTGRHPGFWWNRTRSIEFNPYSSPW